MPSEHLATRLRERLADFGGDIAKVRDQITDASKVVYRPLEGVFVSGPGMWGACC